eukprot:COSAG04_NODE_2736_length_3656_cov_2.037672_1_plen_60_part_10
MNASVTLFHHATSGSTAAVWRRRRRSAAPPRGGGAGINSRSVPLVAVGRAYFRLRRTGLR